MAPTNQDDEEEGKQPLRSKRLREKATDQHEDEIDDGGAGSNKKSRTNPDEEEQNSNVPGGENDPTSHRWKVEQMTEDYCEFASNVLLTPLSVIGSFGYNESMLQYPLDSVSALSYLKSKSRRPLVLETWSPYEVALFEASIMEYGKNFHTIQKEIGTKSTKDIIDFYYVWKKTSHYRKWKQQYVPPHLELSDDEDDDAG